MPPARIISELHDKGIVPREYEPLPHSYHGNSPRAVLDEFGRVVQWEEPLPGPPNGFEGFTLNRFYHLGFLNDHSVMGEVFERCGIEWTVIRMVYSQPYGPPDKLKNCTTRLLDMNIDLTVVEEPHLSWYCPGATTLCLMKHKAPLSFKTFSKTFRFWLLLNSRLKAATGWGLRESLLPRSFQKPDSMFFDLIYCADETSVRLGLDQTSSDAFQLTNFIDRDTFAFLWTKFRFDVSWRPLLLCCLFIARLRYLRQDRIDHTPPFGRLFLEACDKPMG